MSGLDRVIYTNLEQLLSSDLNLSQRLSGRMVVDAMRLQNACQFAGINGIAPLEQGRPIVLGGLEVAPDAVGTVRISAGMLLQPWPGTGTAPLTDESSYVVGRNHEPTILAVPASDTWCLVQARATESATSATRNVWNKISKAFDATLIGVQRSNVIEFSLKVGTTDVPNPDAGWVPVAAFQAHASGIQTMADVIDLRVLPGDQQRSASGEEIMLEQSYRTEYQHENAQLGYLLNCHFDVISRAGQRVYFHNVTDDSYSDFATAALRQPGLVLAINTWYYLYLATWNGCAPRRQYGNARSQGILFVSSVPPTLQGRRDHGAGLQLPAPWSLGNVAAAVCVGAIRSAPSNANVDGFTQIGVVNGHVNWVSSITPEITGNADFAAQLIPVNARSIVVAVTATGTGTAVPLLTYGSTRRLALIADRAFPGFQKFTPFDVRGLTATSIHYSDDSGNVNYARVAEMEL